MFAACSKSNNPPEPINIKWEIQVSSPFAWVFYHINSQLDTAIAVTDYQSFIFSSNDTLMFVASGKELIKIKVLRAKDIIDEYSVSAFDRDTLNLVLY